jgi:hypothetical protein
MSLRTIARFGFLSRYIGVRIGNPMGRKQRSRNCRPVVGPLWGSLRPGGSAVQDMTAQLEKLLALAIECALIGDLATDPKKREYYKRLAEHLLALASDVECATHAQQVGLRYS